eukprot:scaffold346_cov116-Cylindrotheca_fusiformis.AAC.19
MSYDYNELVSKIASSRRSAAESEGDEKIVHLQEAVDRFSILSTQCPMTPLLWMQYSSDTAELLKTLTSDIVSAQETHQQLLELALAEFPGSAILHLRYLQVLNQNKDEEDKVRKAIRSAIENVGQGSHRNEGELVAAMYRMDAEYQVNDSFENATASYCQRACVPMRDVNDSLSTEYHDFCMRHGKKTKPEELQLLENGRRYEAKVFSSLITFEDEVDMTMHAGGILPRHQIDLNDICWDDALKSDGKTFWMGLGGVDVANAFVQYARACSRYRKPLDFDDGDNEIERKIQALSLCVYERGVAECPTVESIWLAYVQHLQHIVERGDNMIPRLKSVVDRAVRNCPYSLSLFQQKIRHIFLMASSGKSVMDPDELMKIVKEALDAKFITAKESCLDLHMTAIQVMRQYVLSLLASASDKSEKALPFDGVEPANSSLKFMEIDKETAEELEDSLDDIREMYDAVDHYVRKHFPSWSEGRSYLWLDRSITESYLIGPLSDSFRIERTDGSITQLAELIRSYDKATNLHKPANPEAFISYAKAFLASFPTSSPSGVLSKLRQVRWLYQKAMKNVGPPKQHSALSQTFLVNMPYETSLQYLCHDYLVFERCFGSDKSLADASKVASKKMAKVAVSPLRFPENGPPASVSESKMDSMALDSTAKTEMSEDPIGNGNKRTREDDDGTRPAKMPKTETATQESTKSITVEEGRGVEVTTRKTDLRVPKPAGHKVKIGNLEYPVHPFTVRVSNLASNTEDMDLVDTFRPVCGAVVHARIMREKSRHGKGQSKGWGLIQFEEKESVEKALELSEVLGIKEKLVKVERSHLPAAGLVPPGMHRVNPKGKGKGPKRIKTIPESKDTERSDNKNKESADPPTIDSAMQVIAAESTRSEVLSFRPRGLGTGRKPKVSLSTSKKGH